MVTSTGPRFAGCARPGRTAPPCSPKWPCPSTEHSTAARYGIHPALLDACLHAAGTTGEDLLLPFSWAGVRLHADGATAVRVRIEAGEHDRCGVVVADGSGSLVLSAESVAFRPASTAVRDVSDAIFRVEWVPAPLPEVPAGERLTVERPLAGGIDWGSPLPQIAVVRCPGEQAEPEEAAAAAITVLQDWLADEHSTSSQLVMVTSHAIGPDTQDLASAPIWGVMRSANRKPRPIHHHRHRRNPKPQHSTHHRRTPTHDPQRADPDPPTRPRQHGDCPAGR
ncbi:polyketide synthase dehydratase domain-containing protein [Actinoallomurus acaciae]|uniref:Polyketide synthase dehydratase domain-containing protein n=1 Tax=Actinoallomurus acaciae TaxID=502577 RepID=A0ABV5Z1X3_9ACTN